ncbi:Hypothetical predicted protein [Mytilus galloprovincialis]|uniref:Reverse transcriptase domain-containing protein n=1 Tax=Mytilus galloprovincialis TaxID=29158 RepID=A0A8B6EPR0_MYTGA|nr:Hypothetical predicted protein [Mytilus galloprovincialis]
MVLPPVLKKRYSLKGMKLVPVIKRIRPGQPESLKGLARMNKELKTENLNMEEIAQHVKVLTGEDLDEICQLSGRSDDDAPIQSTSDMDTQPKAGKRKPDSSTASDTLEDRIASLKKKTKVEIITELKDKLARQANRHYSKLDISSLCLSVLGGKAVDTITKAISKCLKEKQSENKNDGNAAQGSDNAPKREESPLSNLYPQFQNPLMYSMYQPNYLPQGVQPYGNFTAGGYRNTRPMGARFGFRPRGACHFCESRVPSLTNLSPRAEEVYHDNVLFDIDSLQLRDPDKFVSGQLHNCVSEWRLILDENAHQDVVKWLEDGVDVGEFFRRFKGNFKGRNYDSEIPPRNYFQNAAICKKYSAFISKELCERISTGCIKLLGRVGECQPPKVIMPLTVEPSKPRLCHDERYLNLWVKDLPFHLENLKDVHRLVQENALMITCDEKSGYDHVNLQESSQTYFGGSKNSDDAMLEASKITYMVLQLLTRLGYTLSLSKCSLIPGTCKKFLGFLVDSVKQAYILPDDKKLKFIDLRKSILLMDEVDLRTLQRFCGKCISLTLAVPGCKLFCREVNAAISTCVKNSRKVKVLGPLRDELMHWRFLDTWTGYSKWRSEFHKVIELSTDSSGFRPIHEKEADAVLKSLQSLDSSLQDSRVDLFTDNMAVIAAWENQGCKSRALSCIMKEIFSHVSTYNIDLHLKYVPSCLNEADAPSRLTNTADSMLSEESWLLVESLYGPHSVDLMSLDSNVMKSSTGVPLKHFTPWPTPCSAGVNLFSQNLRSEQNPYVYPPFVLVFPVLSLLREQGISCTIIVPEMRPLPIWWPILKYYSVESARPIFLTKIRSISAFISRELQKDGSKLKEKFVLYRDQAWFKLQYFAGDRASDLSIVVAQDGSGFVFQHTFGKTLRGKKGRSNSFVIKRCDDNVVCPVKGLLDFVQFAHSCNVDLTKGYLLRVVSESGRVLEKPVSYSVVYERLRYYLSTLGIYEGETPHSFRSGCTVTMALSDSASNVDEVMNHVGWFGKASAEYYGRVNTLIDSEIVASNLAASVSQAENIELQYREKADFSGLKRVFLNDNLNGNRF